MILYNSNYFGLLQLINFNGSAVYRTTVPSVLSTGILYLFKYTFGDGKSARDINGEDDKDDQALFTVHPFVITIYIMAFSLIINHRLNYSYQRYWESCSNIFMMSSKWMDSATALAAFHYQSSVYEKDRPRSFGDEDKPQDQLRELDKNKSAPTGGNTRTAMTNPGGFNPMTHYDSNVDDLDRTAASDTSDSGSSTVSFPEEPSSLTASAAREASMGSHRSFISLSSRERVRRYSEEENYKRTRKLFSNTNSIDSFRQIIRWKRMGKKRKFQSRSSLSDFESSNGSSLLFNTDFLENKAKDKKTLENDQSTTPPRNNLASSSRRSISGLGRQFNKSQSMPTSERQGKRSSVMGFSLRKYGGKQTTVQKPEGKSEETETRHRRIPSTDIPLSGAGGTVVKSFKPNPSLAWQKQNRIAMPSNTGLHSTVYEAPLDFDFEELLLEEEKERKEARHRRSVVTKQRPGTSGVPRRQSSFPTRRKSTYRAVSNASSEIGESTERISSDPTTRSSLSTMSTSLNNDGSAPDSMRRPTLPNFLPRLELHDLPSLYENSSKQNSENSFRSSKKARLKSDDGSSPVPFSPGSNLVNSVQQSSSYRAPMEKMNGRASLFLQEAAHLYSLMSAVAMASLRADMEGVSSPLVDYVPGQKFPPVNPEEMQIKILVTQQKPGKGSKNPASDLEDSKSCKIGQQCEKTESDLRIKIMRKNTFLTIFMFLLGTSRNSRQRTIYNASRPFSVLGGVSDAEVAMLRKVRGHSAQHALCCLWLREFITREYLDGSTGSVAPPIVARVYQHLSDGTQQWNNCRKTAFTDFPFPHAQLTAFFSLVSLFIFPLLYYTYVNNTMVAVILNFFSVSCFLGILEVAVELEQPFIRYPNDLPLNNYQAQFNEALISSLYGGFHPDAWGDTHDNGGEFSTSFGDGGNEKQDERTMRSSSPVQATTFAPSSHNRRTSTEVPMTQTTLPIPNSEVQFSDL